MALPSRFLLAAVGSFPLLAPSWGYAAAPPAPTAPATSPAQTLLTQLQRRYAAIRSYRDSGTVTTSFEGDHPFIKKQEFETAFVRPGAFFFSVKGEMLGGSITVWTVGDTYRTWWSLRPEAQRLSPGLQTWSSISQAVGALKGVSDDTSYYIPHLLLSADAQAASLPPPDSVTQLKAESVRGHPCDVVRVETKDYVGTLWIAQDTGLVLRRVNRQVIPPPAQLIERMEADFAKMTPKERAEIEKKEGKPASQILAELEEPLRRQTPPASPIRTERTTEYEPVANEDIPPVRFHFDVPDGGSAGSP